MKQKMLNDEYWDKRVGMVEHHVKYKEIHGYDETMWMTRSEHKLLHHRLRKEGKCNIPVNELTKISNSANKRTGKVKKYNQAYKKTEKVKKYDQAYKKTEKSKNTERAYKKNTIRDTLVSSSACVGKHVSLRERIKYNLNTGNPEFSSSFCCGTGYKLISFVIG